MKSKRLIALAATLLASTGGFVACGGDDSTPITAADAGGDGTAADATTQGDAAQDGGGGGDATNGDADNGDALASDAGDASSDAGDAAVDGALVPDASSTVTDAGPGGDGAVLSCGSASCALPAETCCVYPDDAAAPFFVSCATGASCPVVLDAGLGTPVSLQCETRANCPSNNTCCITKANDGTISSHCEQACASSAGAVSAELCDPTLADAGCGAAGACSSTNIGTWDLPSGFATCGGKSAN